MTGEAKVSLYPARSLIGTCSRARSDTTCTDCPRVVPNCGPIAWRGLWHRRTGQTESSGNLVSPLARGRVHFFFFFHFYRKRTICLDRPGMSLWNYSLRLDGILVNFAIVQVEIGRTDTRKLYSDGRTWVRLGYFCESWNLRVMDLWSESRGPY